jgi:hypothetical protein
MKRILFAALLLASHAAMAQTLGPTVIASGGRFASAGGYTLSYTVGEETAVATSQAGGFVLTQGFQQPDDKEVGVTEIGLPDMNVKLYPNPADASVSLWLQCTAPGSCANLRVTLHDLLGRTLTLPGTVATQGSESLYTFDLRSLAASVYFVRLQDPTGAFSHTIKFTKTTL